MLVVLRDDEAKLVEQPLRQHVQIGDRQRPEDHEIRRELNRRERLRYDVATDERAGLVLEEDSSSTGALVPFFSGSAGGDIGCTLPSLT